MNAEGKTVFIEDMTIGMRRTISKTITLQHIEMFAEVSEDWNPIHLDEETGRNSVFGERIAHGMLSASLFSALIGEQLPGHGAVYLGQTLKFLAPVKIGDTVTARIAVSEINLARRRIGLACEAVVDGNMVITGEATVLAPSRRMEAARGAARALAPDRG